MVIAAFKEHSELLSDTVKGGNHTEHAVYLMNLSILELLNENYDRASHLICTSHELVKANLGTNNYFCALTLLIKSTTLSQLQSEEEIESYVQEAKSVTEKLCINELQK